MERSFGSVFFTSRLEQFDPFAIDTIVIRLCLLHYAASLSDRKGLAWLGNQA